MIRNKTKGSALFAAALAGALTLTACGGGGDSANSDNSSRPSSSSSSPAATPSEMADALLGQAGVNSAASGVRATLTGQLTDHVYLAGTATGVGLDKGIDSPEFAAAAAALDENSVALSETIASVYGEEGGAQFLDLWRKHIGFFVDYTVGSATGDTAKKDGAKAALDGYKQEFGAFLDSATEGNVPKDAVVSELDTHVQTLIVAIDAQVAKDPNQFALLSEAASHMPMTAQALAGGIDTQQELEGDPNSDASGLRSLLTAQLTEHVYLAGTATGVGINQGVDSENFAAAAAALDANSVALSESITSVYGEEGGAQFLDLWRAHIGFFVDYTVGSATGDTAKKDGAKTALDNYKQDFGAFLDSATEGNVPKDAVVSELDTHVQTLIVAIDAQVAKDPNQFSLLAEAASHMPMTAQALAGGIAEQNGLEG